MAEKSLLEHLDTNPEDCEAIQLMAQIYEQKRDLSKAFEMYEQRYLLDPSKTGAILDICRILMLSETNFDKVDYKYWYDLARKHHGVTNPIVKNLGERVSSTRSCESPQPQQNPIKMIFEKLTKIDERLAAIEQTMATISLKNVTISDPEPTKSIQSTLKPTPTKSASNTPKPTSTNSAFCTPQQAQVIAPKPVNPSPSNNIVPSPAFSFSSKPAVTFGKESQENDQIAFRPSLFSSMLSTPNALSASNSKSPSTSTTTAPVSNPTFTSTFTTTTTFSNSKLFGTPTFGGNLQPFKFPTSGTDDKAASLFSSLSLNKPLSDFNSVSKPEQNASTSNEANQNDETEPSEVPIENFCTLKPIEQKTGEEDEDVLFKARSKLFRLINGEWKERGLDDIKVLRNRETGLGRLVMRNNVTGKVCLNCWNFTGIKSPRENWVQWGALDNSDETCESRVFNLKLKNKQLASEFMNHLMTLADNTGSPSKEKPKVTDSNEEEIQLVDPKLDLKLVEKAQSLKLPDLFFHNVKHREGTTNSNDSD